jgi:hypothetical protein
LRALGGSDATGADTATHKPKIRHRVVVLPPERHTKICKGEKYECLIAM